MVQSADRDLQRSPGNTPSSVSLSESISITAREDVQKHRRPKTKQELLGLFSKHAGRVDLKPEHIKQIYDKEYERFVGELPWSHLVTGPWGVLKISILALAIATFIWQLVLGALGNWLYDFWKSLFLKRSWHGTKLSRRMIKNYVQSFDDRNLGVVSLWNPGTKAVRDIRYVPVGAEETKKDVDQLVLDHLKESKSVVILGKPGSGKTVLLWHLAQRLLLELPRRYPRSHIPVWCSMRLYGSGKWKYFDEFVHETIKDTLRCSAETVQQCLNQGHIAVLLDGFDETPRSVLEDAMNAIGAFRARYAKCPVVMTCRLDAYSDAHTDKLSSWFHPIRIAGLDSVKISMLLDSEFPGQDIERIRDLTRDLTVRSDLAELIRNPMSLIMVAEEFLAAPKKDSDVLPSQRTYWYKTTIKRILARRSETVGWKEVENIEPVLRKLGLWLQECSALSSEPSKSENSSEVWEQVRAILQTNDREAIRSLLDEIVVGTGFLQRSWNRRRYWFAHPSFQEFFAAEALRTDVQGFSSRFSADPGLWREPAKFLCGMVADGTTVLEHVLGVDPLTALECLGQCQHVEAALFDTVVEEHLKRIGEEGPVGVRIQEAFAHLAAVPGVKGKEVSNKLAGLLAETDPENPVFHGAAKSLQLSKSHEAAKVLVQYPHARNYLILVGDRAVPELKRLATQGDASAVEGLRQVGTVAAAYELIELLWSDDRLLAGRSGLALANLLRNPDIEQSIRDYPLESLVGRQYYTIYWEPFDEPERSALPCIASQICTSIAEMQDHEFPETQLALDYRIAVPILVRFMENQAKVNDDHPQFHGCEDQMEQIGSQAH